MVAATRSNLRPLAWVLGLTAVLRLPALRWPVISDDEAIYHAIAGVLRGGGVMYVDAIDHKPPGLAAFYAFWEGWGGIAAVHWAGLMAAVLTAWGIATLLRFRGSRRAALAGALLYGVGSCTKCAYDGLAVNGELLMNLLTVWAVIAVVAAARTPRPFARFAADVAAGALVGIAGLFKWQALIVGLAFPWFGATAGSSAARALRRGPSWLLGLALPLVAAVLYFQARGALADAWRWGWAFNGRYLAEGPPLRWALHRLLIQVGAVVLPAGLLYAGAARGTGARLARPGPESVGLLIWAAASLLCVGLGRRFFGHYFLQAELPLSLLAAEPVARWAERRPYLVGAALGVPALFFAALACQPDWTRRVFDAGDPDWATVGRAVAERSVPGESLFVWGNAPVLYYFADRPMGTRFCFCNYLTGLSPGTPSEYDPHAEGKPVAEAWADLRDDFQRRPPDLVLDTSPAGWKGYGKYPVSRYLGLVTVLKAHYRVVGSIEGAVLYRRVR